MKDKELTPDDVAQIFMRQVIDRVYSGALGVMKSQLEDPKTLKKGREREIRLFEWYANLDQENREMVWEVIRNTVFSTTFRFLVLVDNAVDMPLQGKVSDFAIYLQTYENWENAGKNAPAMQVRFNPPFAINDLHDMLYFELGSDDYSE
jgi:hypothetical protein